MKNFIVLLQGWGYGCDHTIACNKDFKIMEAETKEEVWEKLKTNYIDYEGEYISREEIKSAEIIELNLDNRLYIDFEDEIRKFDKYIKQKTDRLKDEDERS